jgi:hypothetical protein
LALSNGCAWWNLDRLNPEKYRDERALDIEEHLSRERPIVANPF